MSVPSSAPPPTTVFAHPSEAEIARLLDFYGVVWEYEPRSFPLEWDAEGRPTRSFTPDFYLPEYDLFLEVTTIKPALAHRKHRKIRQLRELHPDVMIKLLSLRDVEALLLKYGRRHGRPEGEVETRKSLSGSEESADCSATTSTASASPSVPTDLATRRDRSETETQ